MFSLADLEDQVSRLSKHASVQKRVGESIILILGLIWQIIKLQLTSNISLKDCPELVLLLEDGEEVRRWRALRSLFSRRSTCLFQ